MSLKYAYLLCLASWRCSKVCGLEMCCRCGAQTAHIWATAVNVNGSALWAPSGNNASNKQTAPSAGPRTPGAPPPRSVRLCWATRNLLGGPLTPPAFVKALLELGYCCCCCDKKDTTCSLYAYVYDCVFLFSVFLDDQCWKCCREPMVTLIGL